MSSQHQQFEPPQSTAQPQQGRTSRQLEQALSPELQQALQQFVEAAKVCEWCADRCADEGRMMAECLRLCRDVASIASLNARFVARDSSFGPELAQTFISAARACAMECAQHEHQHCQDCARVLGQAIETTQRMLQSLQPGGHGSQQSGGLRAQTFQASGQRQGTSGPASQPTGAQYTQF